MAMVSHQFDLWRKLTDTWRDAARNVTTDQYDDAMNRLSVYKNWLLQEVLQVGKRNTLIVIPITTQAVDYRDQPAE